VYQIVHVRNVPAGLPAKGRLSWRDLGPVFQDLDPEDQKSWCVETHGRDGAGGDIDPEAFLSGTESSDRAYCSFLVQHDRSSLDRLAARLPAPGLGWEDEAAHEPAIWIFFGRNPAGNPGLDGRPEHTDSVSHDGTWHYQLSGRKEWSLRPSSGLLRHLGQILPSRATAEWTEELNLVATCSERDVLAVNTRLWFHRTLIPAQRGPSVSLARDFRFAPGDEEDAMDGGRAGPGGMSNLDGLYARADIEEGTVVFTELEMPDAELHVSSSDPNCRVVTLEDGSSGVVSTRLIRAGEFFCVPESPSDDDVEDDEEPDDDGAEKEEDEAGGYAGDGSEAD
jgi:U3 small nucleolar RNA-associated protein 6